MWSRQGNSSRHRLTSVLKEQSCKTCAQSLSRVCGLSRDVTPRQKTYNCYINAKLVENFVAMLWNIIKGRSYSFGSHFFYIKCSVLKARKKNKEKGIEKSRPHHFSLIGGGKEEMEQLDIFVMLEHYFEGIRTCRFNRIKTCTHVYLHYKENPLFILCIFKETLKVFFSHLAKNCMLYIIYIKHHLYFIVKYAASVL